MNLNLHISVSNYVSYAKLRYKNSVRTHRMNSIKVTKLLLNVNMQNRFKFNCELWALMVKENTFSPPTQSYSHYKITYYYSRREKP